MSKLSGVFFDFGGVLAYPVWDMDVFMDYVRKTLNDYNIDVPDNFDQILLRVMKEDTQRAYKTLRENPFEVVLAQAFDEAGVKYDPRELTDIVLRISEFEFHKPMQGSKDVIRKIKELGLVVGVISNTRFFIPRVLLKREGIAKYLDIIVLSRDIGYIKPHPKIFEYVLEKTGVKAKQSIYIGDVLEIDVYGAKKVGMRAILFGKPEPVYKMLDVDLNEVMKEKIEPDYKANDLYEVLEIIKKLV